MIAFLYNSPSWARSNPDVECPVVAPPAARFIRGPDTEWRYFVTEFARRFGPNPRPGEPDYTGARLEAVEIWNEPNLPKFWGAEFLEFQAHAPQTYADLVDVGSAAVDSVAPGSLTVLPGAMSPLKPTGSQTYMSQHRFMQRATQKVDRPITPSRIDGISIHLYADGAFNENRAMEKINDRYRRLLNGLGTTPLTSRPRWITEVGFPSAVIQGQSTRTQRERLHQAYLDFARKPNLRAFIVHRLVDRGDQGRKYGVLKVDEDDHEYHCKLIYKKLAKLRRSLGRVQCPPT